jgi:hypothetical protein
MPGTPFVVGCPVDKRQERRKIDRVDAFLIEVIFKDIY